MTRTSILDGVDLPTLQAQLSAMQTAYMQLAAGAKVVVASYAQGNGQKSVSYQAADIANLTQAILTLQTQIDTLNGMRVNRRRPLRPLF